MTGLAEHHDPHPALTDDAGDHAERKVLGLQHRSLLDMHFDIGRRFVARRKRRPECRRHSCRRLRSLAPASRRCGPGKASDALSNMPAQADEDASVERKREPSSSPKASTSIANGSLALRAARCSTARMPPPRQADRHSGRHRSRCRYASRSAGGACRSRPAAANARARCRAHLRTPSSRRPSSSRDAGRRRGDARGTETGGSAGCGSEEIAPSSDSIASARAPTADCSVVVGIAIIVARGSIAPSRLALGIGHHGLIAERHRLVVDRLAQISGAKRLKSAIVSSVTFFGGSWKLSCVGFLAWHETQCFAESASTSASLDDRRVRARPCPTRRRQIDRADQREDRDRRRPAVFIPVVAGIDRG